jgi:hypothetical protein
VTASDLVDGDLTASLVRSGDLNTNLSGTYILSYNVADKAGNEAEGRQLTVKVVNTALPPGRGPAAATSGGVGIRTTALKPAATSTGAIGGGQVLGASTFKFTLNMLVGSINNEVKELQKRLTAEGVYKGPITGYFGTLTQAGVQEYQTKHGIERVGVVGPKTRAVLNRDAIASSYDVPDFSTMTQSQMKSLIQSLQAQLNDLMKKLSVI